MSWIRAHSRSDVSLKGKLDKRNTLTFYERSMAEEAARANNTAMPYITSVNTIDQSALENIDTLVANVIADVVVPKVPDVVAPKVAEVIAPKVAEVIAPKVAEVVAHKAAEVVAPKVAEVVVPKAAEVVVPKAAEVVAAEVVVPKVEEVVMPKVEEVVMPKVEEMIVAPKVENVIVPSEPVNEILPIVIDSNSKAITDANGNVLIYDYFVRKNTLYLVSTFYSSADPPMEVKIGDVTLSEVSFNDAEPVRYFMCALLDSSITERRSFTITINGTKYNITPEVVPERGTKYKLALTTLFKNESVAMVKRFISYYRGQGVECFYLYYNGDNVNDIMPKLPGVTYIPWNYQYQNDKNEWIHIAQVTQLTSFRLRYWDDCEWVAVVDMDEFIYNTNESIRLVDYLSKKKENAVCIQNYWASAPKNGGKIFYSAQGMGWLERTKWIYNISFRGHYSIYRPKNDGDINKLFAEDLRLLHIINNFHPQRRELMSEPFSNTENITLTRL